MNTDHLSICSSVCVCDLIFSWMLTLTCFASGVYIICWFHFQLERRGWCQQQEGGGGGGEDFQCQHACALLWTGSKTATVVSAPKSVSSSGRRGGGGGGVEKTFSVSMHVHCCEQDPRQPLWCLPQRVSAAVEGGEGWRRLSVSACLCIVVNRLQDSHCGVCPKGCQQQP